MSQAVPGWYPDPAVPSSPPSSLRWWDGTAWTGHVQPVASATPRPVTPRGPTTPDGRLLAGRGWRLLALIVDGIALTVLTTLLTLPAQIAVQREMAAQQEDLQRRLESGAAPSFDSMFAGMFQVYADHVLGVLVIPALIGLVYYVGFLRWRGATPGKLACKVRVERPHGAGRLPWNSIAARVGVQQLLPWLAMLPLVVTGSGRGVVLSYLLVMLVLLLDALLVFGPARRTLHDRVAGTIVIDVRRR